MVFVILLLALIVPRLSIFLLWLFTGWFNGIFNSVLWPVLGFIFMPATLLWYTVVYNWFDNNWTLVPIIGIVIAILIDLSPAKNYSRRRRDY